MSRFPPESYFAQRELSARFLRMKSYSLILALSGTLLALSSQAQTSAALKVVGFDLVSQKRVDRAVVEYEYRVKIENNSNNDLDNVALIIDSKNANVKLIDDTARIRVLKAYSSQVVADTLRVQVDRTGSFSPNQLLVFFDRPSSFEGIDTDGDGIRDDVEQSIEKDLIVNTATEREVIQALAARIQRDMVEGSASSASIDRETFWEGAKLTECLFRLRDDGIEISKYLSAITNNTKARAKAARDYENRWIEPITPELLSGTGTYCRQRFGISNAEYDEAFPDD